MPRIFKGSESTLRLLISKTGDYQALTEIKIKLYTTDIENAIEIIDGIQVCKNIAIITLAPRAFMGMEDGLINYIIDGATEDDVFHTERQSNYMLKSLSYINEDGVATQTMTIETNGEYRVTPNDGLYVDINVNVPDLNGSYDEGYAEGEGVGYNQGKTDGINEQKSKLEAINITENGTYTKEDGYNQIEVNVPDLNGSYDEGKIDGVNEQKSKLARIEITENGTYTKEDGYNEIVVEVPDLNGSYDDGFNVGYGQGKTDGVNEQKSKLESISITENGTYTKEDGYNHIEVNVPDLNGSYDEGKTDGINEQKSKLESINITENGVYSKEDGYNHIEVNVTDLNGSYDEGYDQGQADVAANARVLEITENGNYLSKFSDPIMPTVTGVYGDGTEFHNYAKLTGKVFNTNIAATKDSRIELWWKNDDSYKRLGGIIGTQKDNIFKFVEYSANEYRIEYGHPYGGSFFEYNFTYNMTSQWNHIIFSKQDGLNVNGELICEIQGEGWRENATISNFWINASYIGEVDINANGYFGMIKIDDVVIIPTADGFQNVNTGELLEVVQDGSYIFTENLPIYGEGELYKTINVNVIPKINLKKTGLRLGYSTFTEVPEWVDFEGSTDLSNMFRDCGNLQTIPLISTSNVNSMNYMFCGCGKLQTIPLIDTSSVTAMERMFYNCYKLQTIPLLDTSNVSNANGMFYYCGNLKTLPNNFNFGNCTNLSDMFNSAGLTDYSFLETWVINPNASMDNMITNTNTTYVPAIPCVGSTSYNQSAIFWSYNDFSKLTYFGGWIGRKYNVTQNYILKIMTALSYESCISILNNLYDFTGNGETPSSSQGHLKVHANFLTTVGNEISIGTSKGWTITA